MTSSSSSEFELAQPIEAAANSTAPALPVARLCRAADSGRASASTAVYTPITAATPSTVVSSSSSSGGSARITTAASASARPAAIAISARLTAPFVAHAASGAVRISAPRPGVEAALERPAARAQTHGHGPADQHQSH